MAETFEIEEVVDILSNDNELDEALQTDGKFPLSSLQERDLAELLLDNDTTLQSLTVDDLFTGNYYRTTINGIIGTVSDALYKQIMYTYKYSAVKIFFRDNWELFVPGYDRVKFLDNRGKKQLYIESFMREFDRFSKIIDDIYDIVDINRVPADYLNYLAQVIGFEREDYDLINDLSFRQLLKNIIEIYRIKGTAYSFELFFGFLGFEIDAKEFWFDRRYSKLSSNSYTSEGSKNNYLHYLTTKKPATSYPSGMTDPYVPDKEEIKDTMDLNIFQKYMDLFEDGDSNGYSYEQLVGDTDGYNGDTYTYFKTNIIQYQLTPVGVTRDAEFTAEDLETINLYTEFLTPIFIKARVLLAALPYEDAAYSTLFLEDTNRSDPVFYDLNKYDILTIDAVAGDTGDSFAIIEISDPDQQLYQVIKPEGLIYVGDSTLGDADNEGFYHLYGDTEGDSYAWHLLGTTTLKTRHPMSGTDQTSSGGLVWAGGPDNMFHLYQGFYPNKYYYGDTDPYGDSVVITYRNVDVPNLYDYFKLTDELSSTNNQFPVTKTVEYNNPYYTLYVLDTDYNDYSIQTRADELTYVNPKAKYWKGFQRNIYLGNFGIWHGDSNWISNPHLMGDTSEWSTIDRAEVTTAKRKLGNIELARIKGTGFGVNAGVRQETLVGPGFGSDMVLQAIFQKGNATASSLRYYDGSALLKLDIDFVNKTVTKTAGDTIWYQWLDEDKTTVWVALHYGSLDDSSGTQNVYIYGQYNDSSNTTRDAYVGGVFLEPGKYPTPFHEHIRPGSSLTYDFDWNNKGTVEFYSKFEFPYDNDKDHVMFSDGDTAGTWNIRAFYNASGDNISFEISDNGGGNVDRFNFARANNGEWGEGKTYGSNKYLNDWTFYKFAWDIPNQDYRVWAGMVKEGDIGDTSGDTKGDSLVYVGQMTVSNTGTPSFNNFLTIGTSRDGDTKNLDGEITDFIVKDSFDTTTEEFYRDRPYDTDSMAGRQVIRKGGHYLSGFHTDSWKVTRKLNNNSAYNVISNNNPTYSEDQINERIAELITQGDTGFYNYSTYGIRERDLLFPVDSKRAKISGDTIYSLGDTFTATVGDSHLSFGDSDYTFERNKYIILRNGFDKYKKHLVVQTGAGDTTGDTYIIIHPVYDGDSNGDTIGRAYHTKNWLHYYTEPDEGDTVGDSTFTTSAGFIDVVHRYNKDLKDPSTITLSSNLPLKVGDQERPYSEYESYISGERLNYNILSFANGDTFGFHVSDAIIGDSSFRVALVNHQGGDSTFTSFLVEDLDTTFIASEVLKGINVDYFDYFSRLETVKEDASLLLNFNRGDSGDSMAYDMSFNANHGFISRVGGDSGEYNLNGKVGSSFKFRGDLDNNQKDFVRIPHASSLNFGTDDFTISFYLKIDTLPSVKSNNMTLIEKKNNVGSYTGYTIYISDTDKLTMNIAGVGSSQDTMVSDSTFVGDTWYYIRIERNNTTIKMNINENEQSSTISASHDLSNGDTLLIGGLSLLEQFNGDLDEIILIPRVLNGLEINKLANMPTTSTIYTGDTATYSSITEYTDRRGKVTSIDVLNGSGVGEVYVYDPITGDSKWTTEFSVLTQDSFITLYDLPGDTTNGTYQVQTTSRTGNGDTVVITLGDSLPGSDQGDSGGYIKIARRALLKEAKKVNTGDSVGAFIVKDTSKKYAFLKAGDTIQIKYRGDTNDGTYTLIGDAEFSRITTGDTLGLTTLRVGDSLPGDSGDSVGVVEVYSGNYWVLGDTEIPSRFDYIEFIKTRI